MKESQFIKNNKDKWFEFENLLNNKRSEPEKIHNLFIQITEDLSYSKTYFPNRAIRYYLNYLAQKIYLKLYAPKWTWFKSVWKFWKSELPQLVFETRKELLLSFIIFIISVAIGVVSSVNDPTFPEIILGKGYVEMTKQNIQNGDAMAVYASGGRVESWFLITVNNVRIDILCFVSGLLFGFGSIIILLYNGIMVGAFQYFMIAEGAAKESMLAIWLHGTLEMSAAILAGGAGIVLGKGLLFPKTYSRFNSFLIHGQTGVKLLMGIIPITMFAGIIEGFFTRYTNAPDLLRLGFILSSAVFIVGYFVYLPFLRGNRKDVQVLKNMKLPASNSKEINFTTIKSSGEIIKDTFYIWNKNLPQKIFYNILIAGFFSVIYILFSNISSNIDIPDYYQFFTSFFKNIQHNSDIYDWSDFSWMPKHWVLTVIFVLNLALALYIHAYHTQPYFPESFKQKQIIKHMLVLVSSIITSFLIYHIFKLNIFFTILLLVGLFNVFFYWPSLLFIKQQFSFFNSIKHLFEIFFNNYFKFLGISLIITFIGIFIYFLFNSTLIFLYQEFINMHIPFLKDKGYFVKVFILVFTILFMFSLIAQLIQTALAIAYFSNKEIQHADYLIQKIESID